MSATSRGRLAGALRRAYRRNGPRYVAVCVAVVPQLAILNVILSVTGVALFEDMSTGEFLRILAVGVLGMFLYNLGWIRVARRQLQPLHNWLAGAQDAATTLDAWRTCALFPREMMRRDWLSPLLGGLSYCGLAAWVAYVAWELDLSAATAVALFAGVWVFVLYVQTLRFFALEQALRPVLEDIAGHATGEADLYARGFSLRTRLLAALPAINVITAVTAVGIVGIRHELDLTDLGIAAVVSAAIAASVSLGLTLLLAESVTAPVGALKEATERVGRGEFDARVPVVTTDETGALARAFNQMASGLEQRERLREAFGTFVDPDLTQRVLDEGTDLAGEEVDVSLLFMDVRGFTAYSETADARDVVARLNDLYGAVVPVILRHGGHANKFIGDGLLAVFGAPDRLPHHADRAVAAGIEIAQLVRDRYHGELRVGIGINSGRVVVGTIGGGGRLDFTVIGDPVNTAARVESATRQTDDDLLITEATRSALGSDLGGWDDRPPVELKGKKQAVHLYASRVLARKPAAQRDRTVRRG
jgi:class 3 adenylate cyclase